MIALSGVQQWCPALVGPSEMARWNISFDFAGKRVRVGDKDMAMEMSPTRHPIMKMVVGKSSQQEWETPELDELKRVLTQDPFSLALMQEHLENEDDGELEEEAVETWASGLEAGDDGVEEAALAEWQEELETQAIAELDAVLAKLPANALITREETEETSDSEGSISEGVSESSHDEGWSGESDSSTETDSSKELDDEEDRHEILAAGVGEGADTLNKGQKRRLLDAVNQVIESAEVEIEKQQTQRIPRAPGPPRKLRVLEIFTWSCMLSMVAVTRGVWDAYEPVTLEAGWNLEYRGVQDRAMDYLREVDPDLLVVAWPCSPWSVMQNANQRTPTQKRALAWKRAHSRRTFLAFSKRVILWQRRRGKAVAGENPATSKAWQTPEIQEATSGLHMARFDQCQVGLVHPENGKPMKKLTQVAAQPAVVQFLDGLRCPGDHEHHPIEGGYRTSKGWWASLSEFAGGYPKEMCHRLLAGAEAYYDERGTYVEDDGYEYDDVVPEPIDGDHAIEEEEQLHEQIEDFPEVRKKEEEALEDEQRHPVSREIQRAVEFAHRQLGHPARSTLVRMMKLSGANQEAIRYARRFHCDVCAMRQRPRHPQAATATARPYGFNQHLHIDLKFVHDVRDKRYAVLSMLDLGTIKHDAVMIKTRRSDYVAGKFMRHWVMLYGVPVKITHDQGGEFEQTFTATLEQFAITSDVAAAHAGWQLAAGERHGTILGAMLQSVVQEHVVEGYRSMKLALAAAVMAKNGTISKDGYTPNQRVFGMECRWPTLVDEDCPPSFAEAVSSGSEVDRAHQMRVTARVALLRQDVREKMRRAILRKPATAQGPFTPGTQVYFWTPGPRPRYSRTRGSVWRGPATVLVQEKHKRYFVSWRGRLLLLAEENLRMATREEMAMSETMKDEVVDLQGILRDPMQANTFQDLRGEKPPPRKVRKRVSFAKEDENPDRRKARNMMRGTKSVRKLLSAVPGGEVRKLRAKRRKVSGPRAPKRKAKDVEVDSQASPSIAPEDPEEREQAAPEDDEEEAPPEEVDFPEFADEGFDEDRENRIVERILQEPTEEEIAQEAADREEWEQMEPGAKRQRLQDDVPLTLKRKLMDRDDLNHGFVPEKKTRVNEGLVAQVVKSVVDEGPANEWVTRYELALLKQLTGLPLSAARLHRTPRKRMMKPPKGVARSRLTVMIGQDPVDALVVEESAAEVEQNPRRRAGFEWTGMTMLVKEPPKVPKEKLRYPTYIKSEKGLFLVNMTYHQRAAFEEIWFEDTRNCLVAEIMLLKLKQSGKELDPKAFGAEEWKQFQDSDRKEWEQWIDNGVMRRVSKDEEKQIPRSKIFRSPLRMVRTNKTGGLLMPLVAKSRLVVPGHLDPGLGMFRTDAPTVSLMSKKQSPRAADGTVGPLT